MKPAKTVTIHEAKTNLSKLVARAESGEEIVIARKDKAVAKLVPALTMRERRAKSFGMLKGKVKIGPEFFDPLPDDELKLWGIE